MQYLRLPELREKLGGVSAATIWRWVRDSEIPRPVKLGGTNVWSETAIDNHIASLAEQSHLNHAN